MIPQKWSYDITTHLQFFQMQRNVTIMTCLGQLEKVVLIQKRQFVGYVTQSASRPFLCRHATLLSTDGSCSAAVFGEERCVMTRRTASLPFSQKGRNESGDKRRLYSQGSLYHAEKIKGYRCPRSCAQPRPQGLLAFQYGGGRREDPGTQRTKTIADWCISQRVHTCALIGLFLSLIHI